MSSHLAHIPVNVNFGEMQILGRVALCFTGIWHFGVCFKSPNEIRKNADTSLLWRINGLLAVAKDHLQKYWMLTHFYSFRSPAVLLWNMKHSKCNNRSVFIVENNSSRSQHDGIWIIESCLYTFYSAFSIISIWHVFLGERTLIGVIDIPQEIQCKHLRAVDCTCYGKCRDTLECRLFIYTPIQFRIISAIENGKLHISCDNWRKKRTERYWVARYGKATFYLHHCEITLFAANFCFDEQLNSNEIYDGSKNIDLRIHHILQRFGSNVFVRSTAQQSTVNTIQNRLCGKWLTASNCTRNKKSMKNPVHSFDSFVFTSLFCLKS